MLFGLIPPGFHPLNTQPAFEQYYRTRKMYSLLVDVRTTAEFKTAHLNNALNLPMNPAFTKQILDKLNEFNAPGDVLLFVYGGNGKWLDELKQQVQKNWAFRRRINAVYYLSIPYKAS
ncbi:MAG: rhodanese-like domain-containing protein [Bacteroidota bacterium]